MHLPQIVESENKYLESKTEVENLMRQFL